MGSRRFRPLEKEQGAAKKVMVSMQNSDKASISIGEKIESGFTMCRYESRERHSPEGRAVRVRLPEGRVTARSGIFSRQGFSCRLCRGSYFDRTFGSRVWMDWKWQPRNLPRAGTVLLMLGGAGFREKRLGSADWMEAQGRAGVRPALRH